jgi:hypothetical protein
VPKKLALPYLAGLVGTDKVRRFFGGSAFCAMFMVTINDLARNFHIPCALAFCMGAGGTMASKKMRGCKNYGLQNRKNKPQPDRKKVNHMKRGLGSTVLVRQGLVRQVLGSTGWSFWTHARLIIM